MKGVITWFAENHVASNLLMFFLLLAGISTGLAMKLEIFPESALDKISITALYPGASPAEVEESIVRRIEEKISGLAGIERIDSTAREGLGTVTVEIIKGWDLKKLLDEVKAEVDRITTFPKEAEKPLVKEITRRVQVINLAVYGDVQESMLKYMANKIRDDLTNIPGLTMAELSAVRQSEIHIEVSEEILRRYELTLEKVAQAVSRGSLNLPAGRIKARDGEILVRTKGRRYFASDYENIPVITRPDGTVLTLKKIAMISEGFEEVELFARFQGQPAAIINVYRVADQNALEVARIVKKYLWDIEPSLPQGVKISYFRDMSTILKSRLELLSKNLVLGLILVSAILGIFLDLRLAFWVTLGIPISFAAGLMMLPQVDVSINMISLFGFILVLGIVVDDAIIVGENVFHKQEEGLPSLKAAIQGTIEVGRPVIFSVLTTIVAFCPLLLAGGSMGNFMRNIPLVVILVLAGSLVESLFILPSHLARSRGAALGPIKKIGLQKYIADGLKKIIDGPYARILNFSIEWRYVTLALGIAILLLTLGIWKAGLIKFVFFPKVEGDVLTCSITMPSGTPVARTSQVIEYLEKVAKEVIFEADKGRPSDAPPLLEHTISMIGAQFGRHGGGDSGGHLGQIWVQLLDGEKREISSMKLSHLWRKRAGDIPDAEALTFQSEIHSGGSAIEVDLSLDNHDQLVEAADALKAELKTYTGLFDINDSFLPGKKELQLSLKPEGSTLGLTLDDLARQVRHAFYGAEALRYQRGRDEIKVLVRYPENERRSMGFIEGMRIRTADNFETPFSQVAQMEIEQSYVDIKRAQRLRVIKITADVDEKRINANEIRRHLEKEFLPQLKSRFAGLRYTIEGEGRNQRESLEDMKKGLLLALFCIYALLAIPFKSFSQPLIVMAAIPFGVVGAVIGHLLMGFNISFISLFGIVGLSGVVVNDSLVLVYQANKINKIIKKPKDAVCQAGRGRFRAIILTSVTTFAGLTPMLMERSIQAKFLIPMAVSLGFGVIFATFITLILIPCGYLIMDDIRTICS